MQNCRYALAEMTPDRVPSIWRGGAHWLDRAFAAGWRS
jgi:hypothetical protein